MGTNALLYEGCQPVRDADDVLTALDIERTGRPEPSPTPHVALDDDATAVLHALDWQPTATDELLRRTGMRLEELAVILDRLEESGLVRSGNGWWERRAEAGTGTTTGSGSGLRIPSRPGRLHPVAVGAEGASGLQETGRSQRRRRPAATPR